MLDHRYDNIRVSNIMPGSVDTGFSNGASGGEASWKISAEDVAEVVLFSSADAGTDTDKQSGYEAIKTSKEIVGGR